MRYGVVMLMVATACVFASGASASQLIDRNAHNVRLAVDAKGEALITYTDGGTVKHVLAWDAVNAIAPTRTRGQVAFKLDYAGGWGKSRTAAWKTFGSRCGAYDGPPLAWEVAACKAPDGCYWAVQAWQRKLPNYGGVPDTTQAAWELRLSHWTGALPVLTIGTDWAWHQWDHLYGTYTYTRRSRCSASRRPRRGSRSTPSAATSTSTRSTRPTAPAGSGRTASSTHKGDRRLLLQLQPARISSRPARARSTAPRSRARASRPT